MVSGPPGALPVRGDGIETRTGNRNWLWGSGFLTATPAGNDEEPQLVQSLPGSARLAMARATRMEEPMWANLTEGCEGDTGRPDVLYRHLEARFYPSTPPAKDPRKQKGVQGPVQGPLTFRRF